MAQKLNGLSISDTDFKDLIGYMHQRHIKIDTRQLAASKGLIYNDVKVMLCKYHLGDAGYYRASNLSDVVVKTALAALQ
ncbi:hypothetical protein D9M68_675360 [compost metagenome]